MLFCYFRALRLGGVLTSPQAAPSGLQMTPPSLPGTENAGKGGSPDFILISKANDDVLLTSITAYFHAVFVITFYLVITCLDLKVSYV